MCLTAGPYSAYIRPQKIYIFNLFLMKLMGGGGDEKKVAHIFENELKKNFRPILKKVN